MEYKCLKCGAEFEMRDRRERIVCPDCGASGKNDRMLLRGWRRQQKINDVTVA